MNTSDVQAQKRRYGIVGNSEGLNHAVDIALQVAKTDLSVLITGESGVGKEIIPRIIHDNSLRKTKKYFAVNCGSIPEGTIDSELFGHEKGAFTGAIGEREGYFGAANGGTLFLDEVGELPLATQARLLRVLETGEYIRVGSSDVRKTDVRIVAATNVNMAQAIRDGRFREDLFFRLNVISIEVPPLRERSEDIPLLAAHFLEKFAARNRKNVKGFAPQALDMLRRYAWPGNVRELQNAVERAVILCTGDLITGPELPASVTGAAEQAAPATETAEASLAGLSLEALERRAIEDTLRQTEDNKSEAARRLGITRATLHNKLRKYGLE